MWKNILLHIRRNIVFLGFAVLFLALLFPIKNRIFDIKINGMVNQELKDYEKSVVILREKKEITDLDMMTFANFNLEKVFFVSDGIVKNATYGYDKGKAFQINGAKIDNVPEIGKVFLTSERAYFAYGIPNGYVVLQKYIKNDTLKIAQQTNEIILFGIGAFFVTFVIMLLLIKINYSNEIKKVEKYFDKFDDVTNYDYYDKYPKISKWSRAEPFLKKIKGYLGIQKEKIKAIDDDRKAVKKVFDVIKLKNLELVSLYEFAKTLSLEIDLHKIYARIEQIFINSMYSGVVVLMLKKDERLEVEIKKGIKNYRNLLGAGGIEDYVMKNGKTVKVKEALADARVDFGAMESDDIMKLKEFYAVPLKTEKEVIGVIIVDKIFNSKLKNTEEIVTLSTIGEIVGRAIEKGLKYREMNIGLNISSILYRITTLVEQDRDLVEIFKEVIKSIKKVIDYSSASIYLLNEAGELEANPEYREGEHDQLLENVEFKLGKGIKALAAQKKDTIIIEDVTKTAKGFEKIFNEKVDKIRSFACVPMLAEDKLMGVINLTHKEPDKFREEDKKILRLFANQAAVTIEKIIKDRKIEELIARLQNETITDALTQIYNRRYLNQRLTDEINRAQRDKLTLGLLAIDIDFFKKFNDAYGHQVGDNVLKNVALCIKNSIRVVDIPCRYGGEEFFVILPNTSMEGMYITAERIRKTVESSMIDIMGKKVKITVSVGVGAYPRNATNGDDLIKVADQALYMSKENGRNRVTVIQ